jgi:hypothetical protein
LAIRNRDWSHFEIVLIFDFRCGIGFLNHGWTCQGRDPRYDCK